MRLPVDLGADPFPNQRGHLTGLGVAAEGGLGEDHLAVEGDLESSLRGRDEIEALDDRRPAGEQFVRQTDGTGKIVSGDTELDADAVAGVEHGGTSSAASGTNWRRHCGRRDGSTGAIRSLPRRGR